MSSPIQDVFKTLHQQSETVEQALQGLVHLDDGGNQLAIAALRHASALRPAGEDGYRLHPKLREYLNDHLQLFTAYQSLAEIGSRISQVHSLWLEIDEVRHAGDTEAVHVIVGTIEAALFDIADSVEHNMLYLQALLSTRYGNVRSLEAKKSQNRYYQYQTNALAEDLNRLGKICNLVEGEANSRGMEDLAHFIRRNALGHMLHWQQAMSEMQSQLSREIYRMQEIQRAHKLLARMDMVLRQQPSWRGLELPVDSEIPDFLLAVALPSVTAHTDPLDTNGLIRQEMLKQVLALPPKPVAREPKEEKRYTRIVDQQLAQEPTEAALALERLTLQAQACQEPFSLVEWRQADAQALSMELHVWLVFAVMGLRSKKIRLKLVAHHAVAGARFHHAFKDAVVQSQRNME